MTRWSRLNKPNSPPPKNYFLGSQGKLEEILIKLTACHRADLSLSLLVHTVSQMSLQKIRYNYLSPPPLRVGGVKIKLCKLFFFRKKESINVYYLYTVCT